MLKILLNTLKISQNIFLLKDESKQKNYNQTEINGLHVYNLSLCGKIPILTLIYFMGSKITPVMNWWKHFIGVPLLIDHAPCCVGHCPITCQGFDIDTQEFEVWHLVMLFIDTFLTLTLYVRWFNSSLFQNVALICDSFPKHSIQSENMVHSNSFLRLPRSLQNEKKGDKISNQDDFWHSECGIPLLS